MKLDKKYAVLDGIYAAMMCAASNFELNKVELTRLLLARLIDDLNLDQATLVKCVSEAMVISDKYSKTAESMSTTKQMGTA